MDLKELENGVNPKVHWYYQSKKVPLFRYFKKLTKEQGKALTVIDFGSGSGFFAIELQEAFPNMVKEVLLVDIGYTAEEMAATEGSNIRKMHYIPEGISDCVVVMMDVLEHIEDDYAILQDIRNRLGENAHYFITVPAFMSLWSGHDVFLGHYRRYTLPVLRKLLDTKDCKIDSHYYIYGWIFPLVWLIRRIKGGGETNASPESSDMKPAPAPVNFLLKYINIFEMNFRKINKLWGVTCVSEGRIK